MFEPGRWVQLVAQVAKAELHEHLSRAGVLRMMAREQRGLAERVECERDHAARGFGRVAAGPVGDEDVEPELEARAVRSRRLEPAASDRRAIVQEHRPVLVAVLALGRDLRREALANLDLVERATDLRGDPRIAEQGEREREIVVAPRPEREAWCRCREHAAL